jgi:hypothetical protein
MGGSAFDVSFLGVLPIEWSKPRHHATAILFVLFFFLLFWKVRAE